MGGRAGETEHQPERQAEPATPPLGGAVVLGLVLLLLLLCNGRPIGAGDTRATERVAASLVTELNFDLDEYPEIEPPFSRQQGAHRVSVYPVLSAVLAAPVFAAARALFALDETGTALAGKVAASLLSALAAVFVYLAVGRHWTLNDARKAALLFALGTTVWSTSQGLWQHPAAVLFIAAALFAVCKAEWNPAWVGPVGLFLGLAVAARHADVALTGVLFVAVALHWPRRIPWLLLWSLPGPLFVLCYDWVYFGSPFRHGFSGGASRFTETWGVGQAGLLFSPAKGLLWFTPLALVAAVGLARAFRAGERFLAGSCASAFAAHLVLAGRWSEWHGGESWGPRLLTDALPLLFVFLPEGLSFLPRLGAVLAALSVAVQVLGAFSYDYRWERLYQRGASDTAVLWDPLRSPLLFHARERVVILAVPALYDGPPQTGGKPPQTGGKRAVLREHRVVLFGPEGSRVSFEAGLEVTGAEPTFGDVHLLRGARADAGRLRFRGRWDGLFLRVLPQARMRRLELRVTGTGSGTLYVGERSFWSAAPRWTAYPMNGAFRIRHPYHFPESGGGDVSITLGKTPGEADVASVALVAPGDPEGVIRLP